MRWVGFFLLTIVGYVVMTSALYDGGALVVGAYTGRGYDYVLVPDPLVNLLIDVGAFLRGVTDTLGLTN